jgi:hypothetical protein
MARTAANPTASIQARMQGSQKKSTDGVEERGGSSLPSSLHSRYKLERIRSDSRHSRRETLDSPEGDKRNARGALCGATRRVVAHR